MRDIDDHNYRIAGNFRGRKLSQIGRKGAFYGDREGPFQTPNFSIFISELIISKLVFLKLSFQNLYLLKPSF